MKSIHDETKKYSAPPDPLVNTVKPVIQRAEPPAELKEEKPTEAAKKPAPAKAEAAPAPKEAAPPAELAGGDGAAAKPAAGLHQTESFTPLSNLYQPDAPMNFQAKDKKYKAMLIDGESIGYEEMEGSDTSADYQLTQTATSEEEGNVVI